MKNSDLVLMCLRNLFRRKFRTVLTVTGVVIGTCAIVVMISLGIAISASQDELISSYGDLTVIQVWGYDPQNPLDDEAISKIQALEGVDAATPFMQYYEADSMAILAGKKGRYAMRSYYYINGVYPQALPKLGYEMLEGSSLPDSNPTKKIQIIFGENAAYQFEDTKKSWQNNRVYPWPDENGNIPAPFVNLMNDELTLELTVLGDTEKKLVYEVEALGIMKGDPSRNYATLEGAFMSIQDMKRIQSDYNKLRGNSGGGSNRQRGTSQYTGYNQIYVKARDIDLVAGVEEEIHNMGFVDTYSRQSEREKMQESARRIQLILGGLGGISLFVAAISITNTMIMSVYERTREIGVMKVLGCLIGNIRAIFLIEAGLIGFMGGIIGIGISYLLSFLMNTFGGALGQGGMLGGLLGGGFYYGGMEGGAKISIIPPWLVLLGLAFATLIGLVSGFSPANRAVKISALEAIRQE